MEKEKNRAKANFLVKSIWDWEHYRNGKLTKEWREENICTDEGLNKLLDVMFGADAKLTPWYLLIFESDTTPAAGTTYAVPVFTECTAYADNRKEFIDVPASSQSISNTASKAEFTMNATKTIYGSALVAGGSAASTKGDTAGGSTMYSASKFSASKSVESADVLKVTVTLTSSDV